jgi:uncharacterized protein (DUF58 family)
MLTARGYWFLLGVGFLAFWAVVLLASYVPTVGVLTFTLLLWFLFEWAWFAVRANAATGQVSVERHIFQGDREQPNLWANVEGTVRLTLRLKPRGLRLPFVAVADKLPAGQHISGGERRKVGELRPGEPFEVEYRIHPVAPGVIRFEGVELRIADLCGFFYRRVFLRIPTDYLVLPTLADDEGGQRATKRLNALPPPGVHRLKRAGGGSELLDLREYRPGDPPKMIAWKASARRETLITKELENDVPVRCMLFLDASNGMRIGDPGDTPLARAAGIGAAVAQAASANRDIVGLTVFDEKATQVTKPARTRVHTMQMLRTFAETAGRQPDLTSGDAATLQRYAHSLATEQYPDLMAKGVNSRPFGLYWIPLLDSRAKWILLLPILFAVLSFTPYGFNTLTEIARNIVNPANPPQFARFFAEIFTAIFNAFFGLNDLRIGLFIYLLFIMSILVFGPTYLTMLFWFIFGIRGFFGQRAKNLGERKQLGAVFAALDDDTPAAIERYIHDDDFFVARANRFLADHHTLPPADLYDKQGMYRFLGWTKVQILADALVRTVGVARDNELYVILADLVELADELEPLLRAVRAARGRHHQVLVLMPWPDDMPPPPDRKAADRLRRKKVAIGRLIEDALVGEYHRKFEAVRTTLVKAGVTVHRFNSDDPVRLILQRLEQVRGARVRR